MITLHDCLRAACEAGGVSLDEARGERRQTRVARVRQLTAFLSKDLLGNKSWKQVAAVMNREHSSVIHAFQRANQLLETDESFRELYMKSLGLLTAQTGREHE